MSSPGAPEPWPRRPYLDWLRGIAVLIMIEAHTLDSWTRVADRSSAWYRWAIVVGGFGAPLFLFLAGVTLMLAAGSRVRRGLTSRQAAHQAMRRGAWIFLLAFLFRLQSLILGGGRFPQSLLKVDILNIMGLSMLAGSLVLALTRTVRTRALVFSGLTIAIAMVTPAIRDSRLLDALADPLEAYFRPLRDLTNFTLFPWAAFYTGGCVVGLLLERPTSNLQLKVPLGVGRWALEVNQTRLALAGASIAIGGYLTSFLPPIFPHAGFWTSSPTFFFLRLGILVVAVPVAYGLSRLWEIEPLQEFGRASLFVYWVHVEMVYGVVTAAVHRELPLAVAFLAFVAFTLAMFGLVRLKGAGLRRGRPPEIRHETGGAPKSTIAAILRNF